MESDLEDEETTECDNPCSTRVQHAPQPKWCTRSSATAGSGQQTQLSPAASAKRVTQASAQAPKTRKDASQNAATRLTAAASADRPALAARRVAKEAQAYAPSRCVNTTTLAESQPANVDSGNEVGSADDSDPDMVDVTASDRSQRNKGRLLSTDPSQSRSHKGTALKRKSSVAVDDPGSNSAASDAPQAKRTKASSTSAKQTSSSNRAPTATARSSRSASSTALNSPVVAAPELPAIPNKSVQAKKKGTAPSKAPVVAAQKVVLEKENEDLKARLAAKEAEVMSLQEANAQAQRDVAANTPLIPRPPGERGKNGWNLQEHMGLKNRYDLYSNIRRGVRYAVYSCQINIWKKITEQDEKVVLKCYALVTRQFPFMARFENHWATREFIKSICQNARRVCRKKGISDPTLPHEFLDNGDEGDNGEDYDGGENDNNNGEGGGEDDGKGGSEDDLNNNDGEDESEDEVHTRRKPAKVKSNLSTAKAKASAGQSKKARVGNRKVSSVGDEEYFSDVGHSGDRREQSIDEDEDEGYVNEKWAGLGPDGSDIGLDDMEDC